MDVLDLSRNQLFGQLPSNLSQIDRLSFLDLSNNNLSGKIPSGTQLQSFNASAYMGIPQLCGPPLLKECSRDDKEQYPPSSDSSGDSIQCDEDDPCFYASIALGFITGFWGVCGDAQQYMEIFLFSILHQTKRLAPCDNISEYCQIAEESSKINGNRSLFIRVTILVLLVFCCFLLLSYYYYLCLNSFQVRSGSKQFPLFLSMQHIKETHFQI